MIYFPTDFITTCSTLVSTFTISMLWQAILFYDRNINVTVILF